MEQKLLQGITNAITNNSISGKISVAKNKNIYNIKRISDNKAIEIDINKLDSEEAADNFINTNIVSFFNNSYDDEIIKDNSIIKSENNEKNVIQDNTDNNILSKVKNDAESISDIIKKYLHIGKSNDENEKSDDKKSDDKKSDDKKSDDKKSGNSSDTNADQNSNSDKKKSIIGKMGSWIADIPSVAELVQIINIVNIILKNSPNILSEIETVSKDIAELVSTLKIVFDALSPAETAIVMESLHNNSLVNSYHTDSVMKIQSIGKITELTNSDLQKIIAQPTPTFINRIAANHSSQISGDGMGAINRDDITVFVMDTGIAPHPDLNIAGGRNFTSEDPNDWIDRNGHGTHVAGIIGAKDNDYGIVGVAPGVKLFAIKILGDDGSGSISNIVNGINWILSSKGKEWNGYGIINMSIGGGISTILDNAVANAINKGLIFCIAAGNSSINASGSSPGRIPSAITVGATEDTPDYKKIAYYSNYGSLVDILAPGSNIYSTYLNGGYATLSGTSMATPVVTGTIALMISSGNYGNQYDINFVNKIRNLIVQKSSTLSVKNNDGTTSNNPRIELTNNAKLNGTTNVSIVAGAY